MSELDWLAGWLLPRSILWLVTPSVSFRKALNRSLKISWFGIACSNFLLLLNSSALFAALLRNGNPQMTQALTFSTRAACP